MYANVYIGVTIQKLHQLSDDRVTREIQSYNNPCPSSPSTILRSAYMALNTTARLAGYFNQVYIYIYIYTHVFSFIFYILNKCNVE